MHRYLEEILARRRASAQAAVASMAKNEPPNEPGPPEDPVPFIRRRGGFLIAEVKKASPSEGVIAPDADPVEIARTYARGGADAVSVLCEPDFFRGSREDVRAVARAVPLPVLCKDFIVEESQLCAAREDGARWVLLIARVLNRDLAPFVERAFALGLEPLVEVHAAGEIRAAVASGARLIGVNARDLDTFEVDLGVVRRLAPLCPDHCACIAESGIRDVEDLMSLRSAGAHGFLIGRTLMRGGDPESLLRGFRRALDAHRFGVTDEPATGLYC